MRPLQFFREKMDTFFSRERQESLPLKDAPFIVLDTELTGLDEKRDTILSIGAIRMKGGSIGIGDTFYRLVKPDTSFDMQSILIHEITPSDVMTAADMETALSEFLLFCCDDIIVGHCIAVDLWFLNKAIRKCFGLTMKNPVVDTLSLYGWVRKNYQDRTDLPVSFSDSGLFDIARLFGVDVRNGHNALTDAFITAQIFQQFLPLLMKKGITGTKDLVAFGNPYKGGGDSILNHHEMCNL